MLAYIISPDGITTQGATVAVFADGMSRDAAPEIRRAMVADALLFNDLNVLTGLFEVLLCRRLNLDLIKLGSKFEIPLWVVTLIRVLLLLTGVVLLIYCVAAHRPRTYPKLERISLILLAVAVGIFVMTRQRIQRAVVTDPTEWRNAKWAAPWVLYPLLHFLPMSAFLNFGVLLSLGPGQPRNTRRTVQWAVQLIIKLGAGAVVIFYVVYYKEYALAWHCYRHETHIREYTKGFCPAYTKDGSYLDPANTVCRQSDESMLRCYGDKSSYDELPRRWKSMPSWIHHSALLIVMITLGQAGAGMFNTLYFYFGDKIRRD